MKNLASSLIALLLLIGVFGCSSDKSEPAASDAPKPKSMLAEEADPMTNKGIGPITSVEMSAAVDQALAAKGEDIYAKMCMACHKPTEKFIGPAPKGVLDRRSPEWVMNMILNPEQMVKEDPIAKKLLMEFNGSPMANQHLTEDDARAVLEYFRTL
ncbi:MAG: c-type cytochrome [Saprospiraceae bacterium]|nr:c-type cytochrome [Saprospiraceae bacterium]